MIRVTVELLPGGAAAAAKHMGTAVIANDGTGSCTEGNYTVMLSKWGRPGMPWKNGMIREFPRKRLGPWDLLFRALEATVGRRN